ncbi:MAG TPA: peptidoglycan bridge formation glycyltransferase FemA/FemB family protein [Anaerolineaceae bacterium]|jgi:lipid II:glycine glycyltransferase (peptidoglycan interpeptide bridge formation enzyme)|nr:peptidoglycan bridge formation glycyltransferase FemA/FemB family protein [Chloroflexota bacterium]HNS06694.1 peptidoglycan bridge formation glycyltransferase FemA/FemB family protein [Anaerolineaceae bacterium]HNW13287.1 peptidoglycan bridge formation glycyltransferase FemA/FemB family protein [Anaerolineaceae bacterium]HQF69029.1 peptidoglycan bridge formation glycyltransferase FemA/FemB family protein [Anaerolineaceae bacterium]HQK05888.1 peptidoglycan bridge formation glycyltransferase F
MTVTLAQWNEFLKQHPNAHFLQTGPWGELKSRFGWKVVRLIEQGDGAQILFRKLPFGFTIAYLPKGPVGWNEKLIKKIDAVCQRNRAIFIKIEPNLMEGERESELRFLDGYIPSSPIQPRRTVVVSLEGTEEEILKRMKQKTRYNIHLAEKKNVVVKRSHDVAEFYRMAILTAERDLFSVHTRAYYQGVYDLLGAQENCELLTAYYGRRSLASLLVVRAGENAYYLYGASYDFERNRMPTYLIQWEAMKWAKSQGCCNYDLWGIPDLEEEELERGFAQRDAHDGLWGVYRFKRGFGGEVKRSVGAWDKVFNERLYRIYTRYLKLRGGQGD